ncbi:MAG: AAA family ATPase [Deltaproteobacteria bacterium]|nr:MAG: AAA family ATPase [Deltaproteobacteria bacterium]
MNLFKQNTDKTTFQPLAERMRPEFLSDIVGQEHITGKKSFLYSALSKKKIFSFLLWGPPGCGKTSIARASARECDYHFEQLSAVLSGVSDLRKVLDESCERLFTFKKKTVLFVDEIHRFSKSQQDAFLKHVEEGLVTLIGATTENPSFEIISPLLSRLRVFKLKPLPQKAVEKILKKAVTDPEKGIGFTEIEISDEIISIIARSGEGDLRLALNNLEAVSSYSVYTGRKKIEQSDLQEIFGEKNLKYDKSGDNHFDLISAFHKSLRGSDPDAALYWMERMLSSGEDPFYIIRRMVAVASEDIGNADPQALVIALSAKEAYRFMGDPEGKLALAQAVIYLATAPKSNKSYIALRKAEKIVRKNKSFEVPNHLRNAPTKLMKELGYKKDYKYPHDYEYGFVKQKYLPEELKNEKFYDPSDYGYESIIKKRLDFWKKK